MTLEDWLTTLGPLWAAWEAQGRALPAEQWQATNTAWRLDGADAVRPRGRMAVRVLHLVGQVREVAATHASAAGLLGDFKRPAGIATSEADRVAAAAREDAATYTPAQMIEQFAVTGPYAIATARSSGRSWWTASAAPCCPERGDQHRYPGSHRPPAGPAARPGVPPEVPPAGLEHTVGLVAELTPPVGFIELATGRSEVEVFPVLR